MPTFDTAAGSSLYYEVDDFTPPWQTSEAVLLLHGNFESGQAWYGWVPSLAARYRVVRPDLPGFGASAPVPLDFPWSLDRVIADCCDLMDSLGVERFHVVAAKIGATIARAFAARRPERVATLTLVGAPPPVRDTPAALEQRARDLEQGGAPALDAWVRATMDGRLGSAFPAEGAAWWAGYMASTRVDTEVGFIRGLLGSDIGPDLPHIACPTLVITTQGSGLSTVAETQAWQQRIPHSRLEVLPGDSYHAAVTDAAECVRLTLDFLHRGA